MGLLRHTSGDTRPKGCFTHLFALDHQVNRQTVGDLWRVTSEMSRGEMRERQPRVTRREGKGSCVTPHVKRTSRAGLTVRFKGFTVFQDLACEDEADALQLRLELLGHLFLQLR